MWLKETGFFNVEFGFPIQILQMHNLGRAGIVNILVSLIGAHSCVMKGKLEIRELAVWKLTKQGPKK